MRATFASPAAGLRPPRGQAHRVLACCIIILGHCEAALGVDSTFAGRIFQHALNNVAQYAVPLFFVLAGYSLAPKLTRPGALRHAATYTRRILTLFLSASAFYFVFGALASGRPGEPLWTLLARHAERLLRDPVTLALGGPGHLWFLVGLIVAVWTTVWFRSRARLRYLALVGLIFYAAILLTGPYAGASGWTPLPPMWRRTLFVGTPFVIVGLALRHARTLPPVTVALALIAAGVVCQAAEQYWLWSRWAVSPFVAGTLAGTGLLTVGVSLLAVRPGSLLYDRILGRLGPFTLMTYLIHVAILDVLRPYRFAFDRPTWRWLFPLAVGVLSFSFAAVYDASSRTIRRYYKHGFRDAERRAE